MRSVVLLLAWLTLAGPGWAQVAPPTAPDRPSAVVAQAKSDLKDIAPGPQGRDLSDSDIESRLARIPPIEAALNDALSTLSPRQQDLQALLAQLGSPPKAGHPPEDRQTAQLRADLT